MSLRGSFLAIMDQAALTAGGPTSTTPVRVSKVGSERLGEGRPIRIDIDRDNGDGAALLGTIAVWGVNLPNAFGNTSATKQVFQALDAGTQVNFDCESIPYAAQANYNNIVIQDGVILEAGAGAGKFTSADNGGLQRIVLGTAAPKASRVEVYRVTPVAMVADGANGLVRAEVTGKGLVWTAGTHDGASSDLSRTIVSLNALN